MVPPAILALLAILAYFLMPDYRVGEQNISIRKNTKGSVNEAFSAEEPDLSSVVSMVAPESDISALLKAAAIAEFNDLPAELDEALQALELAAPLCPEVPYYRAMVAWKQGEVEHFRSLRSQLAQRDAEGRLSGLLDDWLNAMQRGTLRRVSLLIDGRDYRSATEVLRNAFPDGMPTLGLRLEFLAAQSRIENQWSKTTGEIESLILEYPRLKIARLLLADHVFIQYPDDPWVWDTYASLAVEDDSVAKNAAQSWFMALESQHVSEQSLIAYATLAQTYPKNLQFQLAYRRALASFRERNESLDDPFFAARERGLAYFRQGKLEAAKSNLLYALTDRWNDERTLGGLAAVYQKLGDKRQAQAYFQRAVNHNLDPKLLPRWRSSLNSLRYWHLIHRAEEALARGWLADVAEMLIQAEKFDSDNSRTYLLRAELANAQGQPQQAFSHLKQALQLTPRNAEVLWAALRYIRESGGDGAALEWIDGLDDDQQEILVTEQQRLRIEQAMNRLNVVKASKNIEAIRVAVNEGLELNPVSPWHRRELASTLVTLGDDERGDKLMAGWAASTVSPDMQYAYAIYLEDRGELKAAIYALESVPGNQRNYTLVRTLERLKRNWILERFQPVGAPLEPAKRRDLVNLQDKYADHPVMTVSLAGIWLQSGERERALILYRRLRDSKLHAFDSNLALAGLSLDLREFGDFPQLYANTLSNVSTGEEGAQLEALQSRYFLEYGRKYEADGKLIVAMSMYRRAAKKQWHGRNAAQLALLRVLSVYRRIEADQLSEKLVGQAGEMPISSVLDLADVLRETGDIERGREVLRGLVERIDGSALEWRRAMQQSASLSYWDLAENFALRVLAMQQGRRLAEDTDRAQLYSQATDGWLENDARTVLDNVQMRRDGHIRVGVDISERNGESRHQVPIELKLPIPSLDGHLLLRSDFVRLETGRARYIDPPASRQSVSEQANGVAIAIGWQAESWRFDVGTTPLGFRESAVTGGLAVSGSWKQFGWRAALSRRPLTADILSYAGMQVPSAAVGAGQDWGGVLASGVKLALSRDRGGRLGAWGNLQFHQLKGRSVEDNTRLALLGGVYWRLMNEPSHQIRLGGTATYMQYDKNLNATSLGLADYFSPQSYLALSVPARFFGSVDGKWSYLLAASITHAVRDEENFDGLSFGENSGNTFGYYLEAAVERRISKRWYLGLSADMQRSDFFEPNHIQLYARYTFEDRWKPVPTPPEPVDLYSEFD